MILNSYNLASGICSKCGKKVIIWGDLKDEICMSCDEARR